MPNFFPLRYEAYDLVLHLVDAKITTFHLSLLKGIWRWGEGPFGSGRVCQTWATAALQCTQWKRGWGSASSVLLYYFLFNCQNKLKACQYSSLLPLSLGEFVAQFKFTVLLMANGPLRITSGPFDAELYKSECDVQDPELKVLNIHRLL